MRLVFALGLFSALLHLSTALLLGAFNIQSFGRTKASNPVVMNIITQIIHRYDIILIQEVRDSDLSATTILMNYVNSGSPQFGYIYSQPLGPSTYKERYLFIYRQPMVNVVQSYTYGGGTFGRPPFVVMFSSSQTAVQNFVLIPQHTSPTSAVREVDALYDVVADVNNRWNTNDIVLLGDFNADCSYVKHTDWQNIRLFTDSINFQWLIPNGYDTTVSGSGCAYDRIVVTTNMMRGVVSGSAQVYNFMVAMQLSRTQALAVSDHFPVEVTLS
ncbi:deoxyribonuclease-1-like [Chelmon rostratus]|uniref:deoxyribonuclease-1-like n=1 Tax=Chelmon rostratus TaxID=109905 RepID=UPI001BE8DFB8|nr:deoxyribonuclease-1-like [Chelmon rostratus]